MNKYYGFLLLTGIFFLACSAQKTSSSSISQVAPIDGKWLISSLYTDSGMLDLASKDMYAEFDANGGKISGKGACNRFFGTATLSGNNSLKIGSLAGTRMDCPSLPIENNMLHLLETADRYQLDGEALSIKKNNKTLLTLIPYPAKREILDEGMAEEKTLPGQYDWEFEMMSSVGSNTDLVPLHARLHIDEAGQKVQGFAGCNRFFGSVSITRQFNSGTMSFGKLGSTRMACPQLSQEAKILSGLETITHYEIRNKSLLLFHNNEQLFVLRAIPK